jgi:hypothetical protein
MDFQAALTGIKGNKTARRESLKGEFVFLIPGGKQEDQVFSPYIAISEPDGAIVPWVPTQADLLALDWRVEA